MARIESASAIEITEPVFLPNHGCPFCDQGGRPISRIRYQKTAEAHELLPDIEGTLFRCVDCGIGYPSHCYSLHALPYLYAKSLRDLAYFDHSMLQPLRKRLIKAILRGHGVLDACSLGVLQVPLISRTTGMRVLDVGCGFGEFMDILRELGNRVTGIEVIPELAELVRRRGHDVRLGELHNLALRERYDVIVFRAVLYRTRDIRSTLDTARSLISEGGEICVLDPCPAGSDYFFRKQFPQGQYYIMDRARYFAVLEKRGLRCVESKLIYGQPKAPLKSVGFFGNVVGLAELLMANLMRVNPYVLNYRLLAC